MIALCTPSLIAAEIYKWVNDNGSVSFTDDISKVPERYRTQVGTKTYGDKSTRESISDQNTDDQLTNHDLQKIEEYLSHAPSPQTKQEIEKEIMSLWENFKLALSVGDSKAALSYIAMEAREKYRYNLELFGREKLRAISSEMKEAENCDIKSNALSIECEQVEVTMMEGRPIDTLIKFVRDLDGVWRIYSF